MCVYEEREDGGGGWGGGKSGRLSPNSFPRMPRRHSLKAELTRGRKKWESVAEKRRVRGKYFEGSVIFKVLCI